MPSPFEAVLLALAAWRIWALLAEDTLLDRPRRYVTRRWKQLGDFIDCPYCLGFWVTLGWVGAFALWGTGTVWAALPFALNAVVIGMNHWLTAD